MDTGRLKSFCAIVEAGSLSKAAELMGISHSGLSKAMAILQEEIGVKLFTPKGRGLELTERGREIYQQSRQILELVNDLKAPAAATAERLRVGLPEVLAMVVAGSMARAFPQGLSLEDLDAGEMESRVLDRRLDFAFTFVPFPHKELEHLKVTSVTLCSMALPGQFHGMDPEQIPYVIPASELKDNPLSLRVRDGWNVQLSRRTAFRANSLMMALRMAQSGACALYAPHFLLAHLQATEVKNHTLAELELSGSRRSQERTQRDLFLLKRAVDEESPEMKTLTKIVRQACRA